MGLTIGITIDPFTADVTLIKPRMRAQTRSKKPTLLIGINVKIVTEITPKNVFHQTF